MQIKNITVSAFEQIRRQGHSITVIDVVPPENFTKSHLAHSLNIPLATLNPKALMAIRGESAAADSLYIICQAGITSVRACEKFQTEGFENVINIEGGKNAWQSAGFPLEKGNSGSPPKRSTLLPGLLILLGSSLSLLVHPSFAVPTMFAGLWLIITGLAHR